MSSTSELLMGIRPGWLNRISRNLAKGSGVRESFLIQLNQFFDSLVQSVESGDPAWMDPVINDWTKARTETELEDQEISLYPLITEIVIITQEYLRENLPTEDVIRLTSSLLPVFGYSYEKIANLEINLRVSHVFQELESARKSLNKLDKSKSDFISVAAHELKTPLTLIEGYSSMLRDIFPSDDESSQPVLLIKGIDNGTRRLREIVDDMIDVSLIDNKLLTINFQPIWIGSLLEGLDQEFQETIRRRKQSLRIKNFPGSKDMTFGDPERIYQAFRNLLTNAIKYTPDGGEVIISGRKLPGFLEITVSDNGIGIDPDDHTSIFQKFGQVGSVALHSSGKVKFKGGGPGLGLPITKGIIEAHGGTIWVESDGYDEESCPGSTFHIMLPIYDSPPDPETARLYRPFIEV